MMDNWKFVIIKEQKLLAEWLLDNSEYYYALALEEAEDLINENPEYYLTGQYRLIKEAE